MDFWNLIITFKFFLSFLSSPVFSSIWLCLGWISPCVNPCEVKLTWGEIYWATKVKFFTPWHIIIFMSNTVGLFLAMILVQPEYICSVLDYIMYYNYWPNQYWIHKSNGETLRAQHAVSCKCVVIYLSRHMLDNTGMLWDVFLFNKIHRVQFRYNDD